MSLQRYLASLKITAIYDCFNHKETLLRTFNKTDFLRDLAVIQNVTQKSHQTSILTNETVDDNSEKISTLTENKEEKSRTMHRL